MPDNSLQSSRAGNASRDDYNEKLRPLLDLPVELLLPTHGEPVLDGAHDALKRAIG